MIRRVFDRLRSIKLTAALLTAAMVFTQFPSTPVFAEKLKADTTDSSVFSEAVSEEESPVKGDYVPGEVIVCLRETIADENEIAAGSAGVFSAAPKTDSTFLMDVSDAARAYAKEGTSDEEAAGNFSVRSEEEAASPVVLKLVRSDDLSTEELIDLYSGKPGILFAEPNYIIKDNEEVGERMDLDPELPETASDDSGPVSGNAGSVSEPSASASENTLAVSDNTGYVSENTETLSGNTVSDNEADLTASAAGEIVFSSENDESPDMTGSQFAYRNGPGGIDVPDWNVHDKKNADGVVVVVLDSGVDYDNEDLKNVMWDEGLKYPQLTALGGGKYGYNPGYDDWQDEENLRTGKDDPKDTSGHGIHCAGIIAAEWNNIGVSGAANGVKIMAVKKNNDDDGNASVSATIKGFHYILTAKKAGVKVAAVNCSFGAAVSSLSFFISVKEVCENDIVTCFAAGNNANNNDVVSMDNSLYSNISQEITVDNMDEKGEKSTTSDYGRRTTDIFAPGYHILSTYPNTLKQVLPEISGPIRDNSGKAVSDNFSGNSLGDCYFTYVSADKATLKVDGGGLKISGTEAGDGSYIRPAFTISAGNIGTADGKKYYLVFERRISDTGKWFFPVLMKNKNTGEWEQISNLWYQASNAFSYDIFPIDEDRFDVSDLKMQFCLANSSGGEGSREPVKDAAIRNIYITDLVYPYNFMNGTSMATPAVTGEVAILAKEFPDDTAAKRAARVLASASSNSNFKDLCVTGGQANVRNALDESTYTPVINGVYAASDRLHIEGYFFGSKDGTEVSITQGDKTWSVSNNRLTVEDVIVNADGAGDILLTIPSGMKRDEEISVTVTDRSKTPGRQSYERLLMPSDPDGFLAEGNTYKRIPVPEECSELLKDGVLLDAAALNGAIYFYYGNKLTYEYNVAGYKDGKWFAPKEPVCAGSRPAAWNGQLLYANADDLSELVFHDTNRVVRRIPFVPENTDVSVPDEMKWVFTSPSASDGDVMTELYYDGRDVILIRCRKIYGKGVFSVVYRVDPFSGKGTYLGTLQNYYAENMVIAHKEKENEPNTFYVVGNGIDADGKIRDFLAESFTLEPFNTTVLNDKKPADFRMNSNETWTGCGVREGIFLTGAHTVLTDGSVENVAADNYYFDYSHPEKGFQPGPKKIYPTSIYHPMAAALNNKVYFLALTNEGYIMSETTAETLRAYGDEPQCSHPYTELTHVKAGTCTEPGYSGDQTCGRCGYIFSTGEVTPVDPNNHDYDYSNTYHNEERVSEPTYLSYGAHRYYCNRDESHTIIKRDIPPLPSEDGRDYSDFVEDTKNLSENAAPKIETSKDEKGNKVETVTVGGEVVSKTTTDPDGKVSVESKVWIAGLEQSYPYSGSAIKPDFRVYDGTNKLTEKTDYTVKWSNNRNVGTASMTVKFKGNYRDTKSETTRFSITPAILGEDKEPDTNIIAHEIGVATKKSGSVKISPVLSWKETGKKVSNKYFTITPSSIKDAGSISANIKPKSGQKNYSGSSTVWVRAVGDKNKILSNAKVKFDEKAYAYTGEEIEPRYELTLGGKTLTEGADYKRVSLCNNKDPGNATIIFEAISTNSLGFVGNKTAAFKISGKIELTDLAPFAYSYSESVPFAKGGAKPKLTVKKGDTVLKEGRDYTLSYSKNKAVTGTSKTAELKIKGKGNYKGSVTKSFAITQQNISALQSGILAADQFTTQTKLKKPSVTITDIDGKKLKANKDYTVGEPDLSAAGNTDAAGVVYITISGKGAYTGEVKTSFRYMASSGNLGKAKKGRSIAGQTYTGLPVTLSKEELTRILYTGSRDAPRYLEPGKDFEVIGYTGNVKKGTAKVKLQGKGDYAGTKTLSFKIVERKVDYKGELVDGEWK